LRYRCSRGASLAVVDVVLAHWHERLSRKSGL
jgi:hypothetical protein